MFETRTLPSLKSSAHYRVSSSYPGTKSIKVYFFVVGAGNRLTSPYGVDVPDEVVTFVVPP